MVGLNYKPKVPSEHSGTGAKVARYALGEDFTMCFVSA